MSDSRSDGGEYSHPRSLSAVRARLEWIRTNPSRRRWATIVATLAGLAATVIHPVGLLIGGALTALPQRRLSTGVLGGLGFGLVALTVFGGALAVHGALATAITTGDILAVTVGTALVLPLLGSLSRGLG